MFSLKEETSQTFSISSKDFSLLLPFLEQQYFWYQKKDKIILPYFLLLDLLKFLENSDLFKYTYISKDVNFFYFDRVAQLKYTMNFIDYSDIAKTKPYTHQISAYAFLRYIKSGFLFDEMGLGKTKVIIDICDNYCFKSLSNCKVLIVCPKALIYNWAKELQCHSNSSFVILSGSKETRKDLFQKTNVVFYISSYDTLKNDLELVCTRKWDILVLDEAHKINNRSTARFKAIRNLHAKFKFALTGTPISNKPEDFWALLSIIFPEFAHLYRNFINFFCITEKRKFWVPTKRRTYTTNIVVSYKNLDILQRFLDFYSVRRRLRDCLNLPSMVFSTVVVDLLEEQRNLYNKYSSAIILRKTDSMFVIKNVLSQLVKLHQIASNLCNLQDNVDISAKSLVLDELLEEILSDETAKVIIWSIFVPTLLALKHRYAKYGAELLYGGITSAAERMKIVKAFQHDPSIRLLIANPAVGGEGFSLTAASTIIYYDKSFSYVNYKQSLHRALRIGTTRNVNVISLVARQTVDEKIEAALNVKKSLSDFLIDRIEKEGVIDDF